MYCGGIACDEAGLCKKMLFSKFLTFRQYIDSLCHYSAALAGVARCHPTQARTVMLRFAVALVLRM